MLHREAPDLPPAVNNRYDGSPSTAGCEKLPCRFRIADSSREADSARITSRKTAEPLDEAECLHAAVSPQERVNFINDNKAKVPKESRNLHMLIDHQRFQRFRRDLQYTGRFAQKLPLFRLSDIAMPA